MYARRDDAGFTLIELLIAVVILAIIIVPLTGAMISGLTTTSQARDRLSEARSPLFTSTYFSEDAQSADPNGITPGGNSPACGAAGTPNVVSFTWVESSGGTSTQYRSSYVIRTVNGQQTLARNYCKGATTQVATVAPILGANGSCGRPACINFSFDPPPNSGRIRTITLVATTPNNENYFTLSATRRAT
jgi:prepilin-type N-terminal cleavage/methylation domain-containing protein